MGSVIFRRLFCLAALVAGCGAGGGTEPPPASPPMGGVPAAQSIAEMRDNADADAESLREETRHVELNRAIDDAAATCGSDPYEGEQQCRNVTARAPASARESMLARCKVKCDDAKKRAAEARARDAKPKTRAQSIVCFRECMKKCSGGRIVPAADGRYVEDPDEWCGTCDLTCSGDCNFTRKP